MEKLDSMQDIIYVNKRTRAGSKGKLIFCPDCYTSYRVFYFSWKGLWCKNKDCDFSYQNSPHLSIPKYKWLIKKNIKK